MSQGSDRPEIHAAWDDWPPPPPGDLQILSRAWGEWALRPHAGVPPMRVDIDSAEFLGCTPLLVLPPRAAAAYLGTHLLSFLDGASLRRGVGISHDFITRPISSNTARMGTSGKPASPGRSGSIYADFTFRWINHSTN